MHYCFELNLMASEPFEGRTLSELCDRCGRETRHDVRLELRTESTKRKNAEFSREPYRVATCVDCGSERVQRMNDA